MAAMAAAQLAFSQCLFDACISSSDSEKQRRPYHRNCGCALHGYRRACPRDSSCRVKLPCTVGPSACSRGRLTVAAPVCSPLATSKSWLCRGGGGAQRPPIEWEEGLLGDAGSEE